MTGDPLSEIETEKAQRDIGTFIWRVYQGARNDGASRVDAFWVAVAWVVGTTKSGELPPPKEEDE